MDAVSVILPVYNGLDYVKQSIDSVLNQNFTDFEFLIIDDCSSDGSWEFLESLSDKRIRLYRNETNKGLFFNLNFLIKKSNSPIVKIWSQDDVMYWDCLSEVIAFHAQHSGIGFSYSDRDYIDATGQLTDIRKPDATPEIVSPALHTKIAFITGSIAGNIANVAINSYMFEKVGLFNENMKISGDFEMWVRLAKNNPVGFIKKRLVQLRNHSGQLSGQEKYYIFHLKEDLEVYKLLMKEMPLNEKLVGMKLLRKQKLVFYYTLMLKALMKGNIKTAFSFYKLLTGFDNFMQLTTSFIMQKLSLNKPVFNTEEV